MISEIMLIENNNHTSINQHQLAHLTWDVPDQSSRSLYIVAEDSSLSPSTEVIPVQLKANGGQQG